MDNCITDTIFNLNFYFFKKIDLYLLTRLANYAVTNEE